MTEFLRKYGTVATVLFVVMSTNFASADFVSMRNASVDRYYSGQWVHMLGGARQAPDDTDNAIGFIYRAPITVAIDEVNPHWQAAAAHERPFNDSYWPTYRGIVAYRYLDRNVPDSTSWSDHHSYYISHPAESYLTSPEQTKKLSPAEKYDLLVGNSDWRLTRALWKKGADYLNQTGKNVPTWFGICHGWAAASHMLLPLPMAPVQMVGANGQTVNFTSTDVRALQSYLWAQTPPQASYIGTRCQGGSVPVGTGPGGDMACVNNNPMSWHLAVTHRIGRDGDSMVMDSSSNAEVWNYAVDSYYFRYFNPRTLKTFRDWKDALVARSEFPGDPFARLRGEKAVYIVGVVMDVFYPAAIEPRENSSEDRLYENNHYVYDLELDENYQIVGGEWNTPGRPDFIWTFAYGARALSPEDGAISDPGAWAQGAPLPANWAGLAQQSATRGDLMGHIVEHLVQASVLANAAATAGATP